MGLRAAGPSRVAGSWAAVGRCGPWTAGRWAFWAAGPLGRRGPWAAGLLLAKPVVFRKDVEFCVKNNEKRRKILWVRVKGSFTLQKKLGPDSSKKWYEPITFVKKYWLFRRAIGALKGAFTLQKNLGPDQPKN